MTACLTDLFLVAPVAATLSSTLPPALAVRWTKSSVLARWTHGARAGGGGGPARGTTKRGGGCDPVSFFFVFFLSVQFSFFSFWFLIYIRIQTLYIWFFLFFRFFNTN